MRSKKEKTQTNLDQIPLEGFRQLVQVKVPGDGARVLAAHRRLGDHLHVVAQGCQASGVQLPEGVQVGADDVGNLSGPTQCKNFGPSSDLKKWLEIASGFCFKGNLHIFFFLESQVNTQNIQVKTESNFFSLELGPLFLSSPITMRKSPV